MRKALFVIALVAFTFLPGATATAMAEPRALFEGHSIDLTRGWGEATACAAISDSTTCFRSEAAMRVWLGQTQPIVALSSCYWSLTLYEHTDYGGSVLYLAEQSTWTNLAGYGFNDKTSSYAIGACDSIFAEHTNGGGNWYPGDTSAWAYSPTMASGWNDKISSVWIS